MTSAYHPLSYYLRHSVCLPLFPSAHPFWPTIVVYFWDCLIRGQMCKLCLAAADACGVGEWQGEGVLICPPVSCNQARVAQEGSGGEAARGPVLLGPVVCTDRASLELSKCISVGWTVHWECDCNLCTPACVVNLTETHRWGGSLKKCRRGSFCRGITHQLSNPLLSSINSH